VLAEPSDQQATAVLSGLQRGQADRNQNIGVTFLQALEPTVYTLRQPPFEREEHGTHEEGPQQRADEGPEDEAHGHEGPHSSGD